MKHFLNELATKMDVDDLPSDYSRHKFETWWQEQCDLLKLQLSNKNEKYVQQIFENQVHLIQNENESCKENTCCEYMHIPKSRMRTSFDPDLEIPKLMQWFQTNNHPTRQQIQQYVNELNQLKSRNDGKTLDFQNVTYWFKNARAAQRRTTFHNSNLESQLMGSFYNAIDKSESESKSKSESESNCENSAERSQKDVEPTLDDRNDSQNFKVREKLPSSVSLDTNADQVIESIIFIKYLNHEVNWIHVSSYISFNLF